MSNRDYYTVLGVPRSASQSDIKSAYRKLAIKYHPDKNRGNKESEERFKEATEAYEVLADPEKRRSYDQFGKAGVNGGGSSAHGYRAYTDFSDIFGDVGDIFADFFGSSFSNFGRETQQARGSDLRYNLEVSLEDAALGKEVKIEVPREEQCDTCHGSRSKPGHAPEQCSACGGIGQVRRSKGFFSVTSNCPNCKGRGKVVRHPCTVCHGRGVVEKRRTLHIKIPPGVESGSRLKVTGEGESGPSGMAGDLYVVTQVRQHQLFERQGNDIVLQIDIPFISGLLGSEVKIPTIDGKSINMKIPSGTQSGQTFRLKGKGMPYLGGYGKGDQHVYVNLKVPQNMSKKAIELAKELDHELSINNPNGAQYSKVEFHSYR